MNLLCEIVNSDSSAKHRTPDSHSVNSLNKACLVWSSVFRFSYKHAIDGVVRIAREEGISVWMRGVTMTSLRGVLITSTQVVLVQNYDYVKCVYIIERMEYVVLRDLVQYVCRCLIFFPAWGAIHERIMCHTISYHAKARYQLFCSRDGFMTRDIHETTTKKRGHVQQDNQTFLPFTICSSTSIFN